jgi:hypothetical protein
MQPLSKEQIAGLVAAITGQPAGNGRDLLRRLAEPFAVGAVSWRAGPLNQDKTKAKALAYIDSRDVQTRLDAVMGADWQDAYEAMPDGTYSCRIGIKVDGEWRWRSDGGVQEADKKAMDNPAAREMTEKGSYSDAFKRAAVKWGIGRYLYELDAPWVPVEQRGNSTVLPESSRDILRRWLANWMRAHGYSDAPQAEPQPATSGFDGGATAAPQQPRAPEKKASAPAKRRRPRSRPGRAGISQSPPDPRRQRPCSLASPTPTSRSGARA